MWYALVKDLSASYYSLVILAQKKKCICQEEAAAVLFLSFESLCKRRILVFLRNVVAEEVKEEGTGGICRVYWEEEEQKKDLSNI